MTKILNRDNRKIGMEFHSYFIHPSISLVQIIWFRAIVLSLLVVGVVVVAVVAVVVLIDFIALWDKTRSF